MSLAGIWTAKGIDKLAAQTAGGPAITIDKLALGDGGGMVPVVLPSQTGLLKEVWRGLVNAVLVEPDTPNAVTVEVVIPYNVGGFYIREWGLYDTDGDLLAVGPHAEFHKPLLAEGSGAELLERIQLPLANAGQVSLTISSEALATRKYVDQTATAKAQEAVSAHDKDATAHGGKIAALQSRKISTTAPLTGGGDLSVNRTIGINASSAATANFVILRDAAGRARVAAPAAADDIARKAEVDIVVARSISVTAPLTGGGNLSANRTIGINATAAPTPNYVIMRDPNGRAQVAAPAAAADIARKADVDTVAAVANAAAPAARTITVAAPLTGGGNLSANRSIGINAASSATATADGAAGVALYAKDTDSTSRNKSATPAGVAAQIRGGNAASSTKLANPRTIRTNLASALEASFDGSANVLPGVTGRLPAANMTAGTAATASSAGSAGTQILAADNTTISARNVAVTPAFLAARVSQYPSDSFTNIAWGATGMTYRAPSDGWVSARRQSITDGGFVTVGNPASGMVNSSLAPAAGEWVMASIPVSKGSIITIYFAGSSSPASGTDSGGYLRFIPAKNVM